MYFLFSKAKKESTKEKVLLSHLRPFNFFRVERYSKFNSSPRLILVALSLVDDKKRRERASHTGSAFYF